MTQMQNNQFQNYQACVANGGNQQQCAKENLGPGAGTQIKHPHHHHHHPHHTQDSVQLSPAAQQLQGGPEQAGGEHPQ